MAVCKRVSLPRLAAATPPRISANLEFYPKLHIPLGKHSAIRYAGGVVPACCHPPEGGRTGSRRRLPTRLGGVAAIEYIDGTLTKLPRCGALRTSPVSDFREGGC